MKKLFISRDLAADSPLRPWAAAKGVELHARSLLSFTGKPFAAPEADWWFFYSSRAVQFSIHALAGLAGRPRLAALGAGTARALEEAGLRPDFVGRGQPAAVAAQFRRVAGGLTVFFPRAEQSRKTVQTLLQDDVRVLDAVCYANAAVPPPAPIEADIYVFTSPLNVAAYCDHFTLPEGALVVAIGPSTGSALRDRKIGYSVAEDPTEEALVGLLEG
ncbi:uroporphyrinogen-III synthase [Lewinella sp. W8]|uniref:uroporphyrinogen-III synthase n=1 Tax=Lewinella sp. W8 TaxID=2528208 RepID=UPI0015655146